jgi:hypothetical protein
MTSFLKAQDSIKANLKGTWYYSKMELLTVFDDSVRMKKQGEGMVMEFLDGNKYISRQKTTKGLEEKERGVYHLSADGKTFKQGDVEARIVLLNETQLVLQVDNVFILYFRREQKKQE